MIALLVSDNICTHTNGVRLMINNNELCYYHKKIKCTITERKRQLTWVNNQNFIMLLSNCRN